MSKALPISSEEAAAGNSDPGSSAAGRSSRAHASRAHSAKAHSSKAHSSKVRFGNVVDFLREHEATYGRRLAIASSFGPEDMVLVHAAAHLAKSDDRAIRVFTLDTGRLPEETLKLQDRVRFKYGLDVEVFAPESHAIEELVTAKGPFSFFESVQNRKECCRIRKVEPLRRALETVDAWVVGLRREQAPTRSELHAVDVDAPNSLALGRSEDAPLVKLSPLLDWTEADLWQVVDHHKIPTSELHDRGYPSIGCAPCTRAVPGWQRGNPDPHLDIRAGLWWWENPEHKECGLHASR